MKYILLLIGLVLINPLFAGIAVIPIPTSQREMAKKGIRIHKTLQQTPVPVCIVKIDVALKDNEGSFKQSILIVATEPVSSRSLRELDSYFEDKASRTERTKEMKVSFSVFGKEVDRAYVVIEVLVGYDKMAIYHRYLLPLSEIEDEKKEG